MIDIFYATFFLQAPRGTFLCKTVGFELAKKRRVKHSRIEMISKHMREQYSKITHSGSNQFPWAEIKKCPRTDYPNVPCYIYEDKRVALIGYDFGTDKKTGEISNNAIRPNNLSACRQQSLANAIEKETIQPVEIEKLHEALPLHAITGPTRRRSRRSNKFDITPIPNHQLHPERYFNVIEYVEMKNGKIEPQIVLKLKREYASIENSSENGGDTLKHVRAEEQVPPNTSSQSNNSKIIDNILMREQDRWLLDTPKSWSVITRGEETFIMFGRPLNAQTMTIIVRSVRRTGRT
ncbi:hypothetical protein BDA99DRAFT_531980 [Phascolomyces articulosus]|uniref:Uncharacterized protein n=1 Tax=Phascolomyces articulosus TaxID=60185 RepID=A0AAD5PJK0_9FUNG|nr:hypothetical protein BDA99DRAFT_531980 [Phascolomyces articulosus]